VINQQYPIDDITMYLRTPPSARSAWSMQSLRTYQNAICNEFGNFQTPSDGNWTEDRTYCSASYQGYSMALAFGPYCAWYICECWTAWYSQKYYKNSIHKIVTISWNQY